MNRYLRLGSGLAALALLLTGCGELAANRPALDALSNVAGRIAGTGRPAVSAASTDPRRVLTRQMIDQSGAPVILVVVTERDAAATLVRAGENRDKITWVSADGIGIVLRDGVLIGTRGLGDDLMGADVKGSQSALRRGGTATRIHDYLTGTDQVVRRRFQCSFASAGTEHIDIIQKVHATTRIDETCSDATTSFINSYWIGTDGTTWKSRQWVSSIVGSLEIYRL